MVVSEQKHFLSETILYSNNETIDRWNAIVQRMNTGTEYKLMSRDSFEEVDDPNGHLKKMLTKAVLDKFWKNGVPNHELTLKTGDICLVTRAINGLVWPIIHECELLMYARILSRYLQWEIMKDEQ